TDRNRFPNPRGTVIAAFGTPTNKTLITDFPDAVVQTAVRHTRTSSLGTVRVFDPIIADADFKLDGSPVRFVASVQASRATTMTIYVRPNVTAATNQVLLGTVNLVEGVNEIDLTGTFPAAGTITPGSAGFSLQTNGGEIGETMDITRVMVMIAPLSTYPWFDGDTESFDETVRFLWDGAELTSTSTRQTRTATEVPIPVDEWLAEIDRTRRFMHAVAVTSGPFTVEELQFSSNDFVAQIVEFTISSERAWTYGRTRTVDLPTSDSVVVQDIPFNLVPYPSAELPGADTVIARNLSTNPSVETDATGWSSAAATVSGTSPASYFTSGRSTDIAAAGTASMRGRILGNGSTEVAASVATVTTQQSVALGSQPAGTRYSISIWGGGLISAGAAVSSVSNVVATLEWLNGSSTVVGTVALGTAADATERQGRVYSAESLVPPATAVTARVKVVFTVGWRSSATAANNSDVRLYTDALAVSIP
ncbi:MAG TPA: hypothetical protein VGK49_02790, partial [Ilumatobacteraceae bacterium]